MEAGEDRRHRLAIVTYANPSSEVAPRQPLPSHIGVDATKASKVTIAVTPTINYITTIHLTFRFLTASLGII